jgi:hypothetical protein
MDDEGAGLMYAAEKIGQGYELLGRVCQRRYISRINHGIRGGDYSDINSPEVELFVTVI